MFLQLSYWASDDVHHSKPRKGNKVGSDDRVCEEMREGMDRKRGREERRKDRIEKEENWLWKLGNREQNFHTRNHHHDHQFLFPTCPSHIIIAPHLLFHFFFRISLNFFVTHVYIECLGWRKGKQGARGWKKNEMEMMFQMNYRRFFMVLEMRDWMLQGNI